MNDKQGRLHFLYAEASKILNNDKATADQLGMADGYINEATQIQAELQAEAERKSKLDEVDKFLNEGEGSKVKLDPNEAKAGTKLEGKGGFHSFGDFVVAARFGRDPRLVSERKVFKAEQKDLAEAAGTSGGFLVPHEFRSQLLEVAAETAIVRPRATVVPMTARSLSFPVLDQTATIAAGSAFSAMYAGVYVEWTEEASEKPQHEPAFNEIELVAHKLTAYMRASDELLADSAIAMETLLTRLMGGAITWGEDYAYLRGDGAGKPQGVLNAPCFEAVTRSGASAFAYADAVSMMTKMLPQARPVWVMNPSVFPKLMTMVDTGNHNIWQMDARVSPAGMLLGLPVLVTEKLPYLNTLGDVILADFAYYLIGDRQAVTIASSDQERFRYDQTSWRCVSRVDGQAWLQTHVHANDGTTVYSPFVGLNAG